jgi:hypothetical protein
MIVDLIKFTYLLDLEGIKRSINVLWVEYQKILDDPGASWDDVNRARAILYFLGNIFAEKISVESLERRIKFIKPEISLLNFLSAIDCDNPKVLKSYSDNSRFQAMKEFYLIVKDLKMRINKEGDRLYLDEDRFNRKYKKLKPKNYF